IGYYEGALQVYQTSQKKDLKLWADIQRKLGNAYLSLQDKNSNLQKAFSHLQEAQKTYAQHSVDWARTSFLLGNACYLLAQVSLKDEDKYQNLTYAKQQYQAAINVFYEKSMIDQIREVETAIARVDRQPQVEKKHA